MVRDKQIGTEGVRFTSAGEMFHGQRGKEEEDREGRPRIHGNLHRY